MFINHIKVHKKSIADCKVKEETFAARSLILPNRRSIVTLTVADPQGNQKEVNKLVEDYRELSELVRTLQKDVFN